MKENKTKMAENKKLEKETKRGKTTNITKTKIGNIKPFHKHPIIHKKSIQNEK